MQNSGAKRLNEVGLTLF